MQMGPVLGQEGCHPRPTLSAHVAQTWLTPGHPSTGHQPRVTLEHTGAHILVSCDRDGEAVIFLPLIFEAGDFGVHGEPVLCFGIKLLSRENENPY